jgi:N12 class adenine-specific DNA methylase
MRNNYARDLRPHRVNLYWRPKEIRIISLDFREVADGKEGHRQASFINQRVLDLIKKSIIKMLQLQCHT